MFLGDEEMADNLEQTQTEPTESNQATSPVDQTKAFAKRLSEEKAKAKAEAKEEIAQSLGFASWQEYSNATTDNKLLDKGLDPESVRPLIKDLIKEDPEYIEAMKYKAEKENLEKEMFASNAIQELNNKYGTAFKSVNELDADTIRLWNQGVPLDAAFAAYNVRTIQDIAVRRATSKDSGKAHFTQLNGSPETTKKQRDISAEEMNLFKAFGFTEQEVREYENRTRK